MEDIAGIMQARFKDKKKVPAAAAGEFSSSIVILSRAQVLSLDKKSDEDKEKKLNGTLDEHDENSNASRMSVDGNDQSGLVQDVTPKRNAQRTAKEKVAKYGEDDVDEEDESIIHGMEIDDKESDYMGSDSDAEKKIKKTSAKPKQPKKPSSGKHRISRPHEILTSLSFVATSASPAKKKVSFSRYMIQEISWYFILANGQEK